MYIVIIFAEGKGCQRGWPVLFSLFFSNVKLHSTNTSKCELNLA